MQNVLLFLLLYCKQYMDWFAVFIINHMFQSNNLIISFSNLLENEKV